MQLLECVRRADGVRCGMCINECVDARACVRVRARFTGEELVKMNVCSVRSGIENATRPNRSDAVG